MVIIPHRNRKNKPNKQGKGGGKGHEKTAQSGMTIKELAKEAGVKYTTLVETTTGRCAGHDLIPVVREYMQNYQKEA